MKRVSFRWDSASHRTARAVRQPISAVPVASTCTSVRTSTRTYTTLGSRAHCTVSSGADRPPPSMHGRRTGYCVGEIFCDVRRHIGHATSGSVGLYHARTLRRREVGCPTENREDQCLVSSHSEKGPATSKLRKAHFDVGDDAFCHALPRRKTPISYS